MNQEERRERTGGYATAALLGGVAALIIKLIFNLVY